MNRQPSFSPSIPPEQNRNDSAAVRSLQTYLRELSYSDKRIPPVPIDGIYASQTRLAVEAFQAIHQLPISGTVNPPTWELLYAEYLRALEQHRRPAGIFPFPHEPNPYTIIPGEESDLVAILHLMLGTISQNYDILQEIPDGKKYVSATERAVRAFQRAHSLPATGRVDVLTWNALAEAYNRIVSDNQ